MSMLTGMIRPTSGTAIMRGKDIRYEMNLVRSSLGYCPQHNILFDDLTVREHIEFYSLLKGLKSGKVEKEVKKYVKLLKLENKIHTKAKGLSGGMKRKLSIGIALCANSKIVLLDEPSSGVDPSSRRDLWELLQKEKKGRTILLSTHFMMEADVLADKVILTKIRRISLNFQTFQIAIMSGGELKAFDTPFFLKKNFGVGYRLICVKEKSTTSSENVTNLVRKFIPNVEKESEIGTELTYLINDEHVEVFQEMLQEIEENSEQLELENFGISTSNLEEVMLK